MDRFVIAGLVEWANSIDPEDFDGLAREGAEMFRHLYAGRTIEEAAAIVRLRKAIEDEIVFGRRALMTQTPRPH